MLFQVIIKDSLKFFLFFSDINETIAFGDLWGSNQTIF